MKNLAPKAFLFAATAALFVLAPALAAPACNLASLDGKFSFSLHGVNPAGQPFGVVGFFEADGAGNLEGFRVSVDNGVRSSAFFSCTYSMSPDCMFRTGASCVDEGEAVSEMTVDGALADNRREVHLLASGLPAGGLATVTGIARQQ